MIEVVFRKDCAHSNHGNEYIQRVFTIVRLIRSNDGANSPIILCSNSGFANQKANEVFEEELFIHFITTGKMYLDIKYYNENIAIDAHNAIEKDKHIWLFGKFVKSLATEYV